MQHVLGLIIGLFFSFIIFLRWHTWWRFSFKEKLRKQIIQESRRIGKLSNQIEEKEKDLAIIRRRVIHLLHRYREHIVQQKE